MTTFKTQIYNIFFKRTSAMAASIIVGSIVFEYGMNALGDCIWTTWNRGKFLSDFEDDFRRRGILKENGWEAADDDEEDDDEDEDDDEL